jgi:fluoroacetyl-CoA thioesterase
MTDLTNDLGVGLQGHSDIVVAPEHLASRWKSGGVDVLSTPQLVGLMELAALSAVDHLLPAGWLTVGTRVDIEHLAATSLGQAVTAQATLTAVDGRRLSFEVIASDGAGVIGRGSHQRYIVQRDRFLASAASRAKDTAAPSA